MLQTRKLLTWPIEIWRRMPVLIVTMTVVGLVLGGAVAPVVQSGFDAFDRTNPVLVVTTTIVEAETDAIVVHIVGSKERECSYIGMQAYTRDATGQMRDAFIDRIDRPERGGTKPLGHYDMGVWRIWPRAKGDAVLIYSNHSCNGRLVLTKLAELDGTRGAKKA
jgi:hypothetical protein